tara:strand:+ start:2831 stop:3889 length:1059 start_codon:yes stop_codon:yes gene_type:complete
MYYFLTASKDASIYLQQPTQNTGLDEILEVSKVYYGSLKDTARTLIKFDTDSLSTKLSDGSVTMSVAELVLRETEPTEVPLSYSLEINPVSQSWEMGNGTRFDDISTDGCTWNYRDSGSNWLPTNVPNSGSATGSFDGKGGMWYTASQAIRNYSYESTDLIVDVSSSFSFWLDEDYPNEGFIIKHESSKENDDIDYGQLKFFSKETHTIYQPKVRIGWDDSRYETGSLQALPEEYKISLKRLKKSYRAGGRYDIEVFARELYPQKTFQNTFGYSTGSLLPTSSFYQIRDCESNDIIIPFGDFSKLSTFGNKSRISLDLTNFEINRSYKVELKIERTGSAEYFDDDYIFEVTE